MDTIRMEAVNRRFNALLQLAVTDEQRALMTQLRAAFDREFQGDATPGAISAKG